jgi:NAD(P)H dehydrogenase (quinone)
MIAITGASGQLGRLVADELARRGLAKRVTLGTRDPAKLAPTVHSDFRIVAANFDHPETLKQLFADSEVALVICGNAPNDVRIRQHRAAIAAAKQVGVRRLVYTSFVNPHETSLFPFAKVHAATEADMSASGLACTFLRSNQYFENLNAALASAQQTSVLTLPGAAGKVAYLAREDIAAATAAVLADPQQCADHYELTGSEAIDLFDIAVRASTSWGRHVSAEEMSIDDYRKILESRSLPAYAIEAQIGIRLAAAAGEQTGTTQDVARLIGRTPKTMEEFLRR